MPATKERRQLNVTNRARFGSKSASGAYTQFAGEDGYLTMTGCARVLKDIWIPAANFDVPLGGASGAGLPGASGACGAGSLFASCVLFDITGSILAGTTASPFVTALNMGVGGSPASPLTAVAMVAKPTDADTAGSVIVYVDWTTGQTPATTGSKVSLVVGMGYLGTGSTIRTAASAGVPVGTASYNGTSCGLFQTTCVGKLPSFTANDQLGFLVLRLGASSGADSGKLSTACVFVLGARLRYVACALGAQSTE